MWRVWYYAKGKDKVQINFEQLIENLKTGNLPMTTKIWTKGMNGWIEAQNVDEVKARLQEGVQEENDFDGLFIGGNSFDTSYNNEQPVEDAFSDMGVQQNQQPDMQQNVVQPMHRPAMQIPAGGATRDEISKIGVSVCLLGGAVYFAGLWSTIVQVGLVLFILLYEESLWLKRNAIKAVGLSAIFTLLTLALAHGTSVWLDITRVIATVIGRPYSVSLVSDALNYARTVISLAQTAVFILLSLGALKGARVGASWFDKYLSN
jgi:hypothetical protein